MNGLVAIHQPNFFPWLGYFDKIRRADIFVFLDNVDYPRSGSGGMGCWTNRVQLSIAGRPHWVTCPIKRLSARQPILAAEIDDRQPWRKKFIRTLEANYGRATQFSSAMEFLLPLVASADSNLSSFNIAAIRKIAQRLGVEAKFVRQSETDSHGTSTELLISLVKAVGGVAYLSGDGAGDYQDGAMFKREGIELTYQRFVQHPYGPRERFLPGLSVVDYLMHDGRPLAQAFSAT